MHLICLVLHFYSLYSLIFNGLDTHSYWILFFYFYRPEKIEYFKLAVWNLEIKKKKKKKNIKKKIPKIIDREIHVVIVHHYLFRTT